MHLPLIFDITKASFDDGPGIRTVVFFKGCPLRCIWCHNPESMDPDHELFFDSSLCIHCGNHTVGKTCFALARQNVGSMYDIDDLVEIILQDKVYYKSSSGGVTFSGGESTLYMDYISEVCRRLKDEGIHIALQTCGYFDYARFRRLLLPYIDLIYFDIKIFDEAEHKRFTGKSNKIILENFQRLIYEDLHEEVRVLPRIPLVEGITATEDNLSGIAFFFHKNNIRECEFLPYNPSGIDKWIRLGKAKPEGLPEKALSFQDQKKWIDYYKSRYADFAAASSEMKGSIPDL